MKACVKVACVENARRDKRGDGCLPIDSYRLSVGEIKGVKIYKDL